MLGKCELSVKIGTIEVSQPVWVGDIHDPCTLGNDFLDTVVCIVDLKNSTLSVIIYCNLNYLFQ